MANVRGFARLGTIAVGLGIGAAVAHSPVASADTSTDWLSAIDTLLAGGAFPALVTPALDYQISFDGYDLFPTTGNLATASTAVGSFGLAIAVGDGADASANSGIGNVAIDIGNNTGTGGETIADEGNGNVAIDIGDNSGVANGVVADDGNGNFAIDVGNNSGVSDQVFADDGNNNVAIGFGNNSGTSDAVFADDGNNNVAIGFGNNSGTSDAVFADEGNGNTAIDIGNNSAVSQGAFADDGNGNTAIVMGGNDSAGAYDGDNNFAEAIGPAGSSATAFGGNHDISYIVDPFGSTASTADSGDGGNFDLAAVLLTDGSATAQGSDFLYDIISALGNESGALPASLATLLTDLAALF
jgi:hypothetical protein